jgi:peptide/nickel transport system permease protein
MELAVFGIIVAFFVGVSIGTLAASRSGTLFDIGGRLFGIIPIPYPSFGWGWFCS